MQKILIMYKKILLQTVLLVMACIVLPYITNAQPVCGFDILHKRQLAESPEYARTVAAQDAAIRDILNGASTDPSVKKRMVVVDNDTVYEIPVVIHVIHSGGAIGSSYNPTDVQLLNMIIYLNQAYAASWPAYASPTSGGTRIPIRFIMAQRAPNCTATSGIDRINGSILPGYATEGVRFENASGGVTDSALKSLALWPVNEYYNIWVVSEIDNKDGYPGTIGQFVAAYARFPGQVAAYKDGTVMLASQALSGKKTLPHEFGHAFNLYHTFQGSTVGPGSVCPANANCQTDGDQVCDTDPINQDINFTCPSSGNNPCTGAPWNNQQVNFMHYTSCADQRFTPGQKNRVMAALLNIRGGLVNSSGLTPPPAAAMTAASCTPTSITNSGNMAGIGPARVKLNTLDDSSLTYSHTLKFYEDHTCNLGTELVAGQSYSLSVSTGYNQQIAKAYIDYNNDGAFGVAEEILSSTAPGAYYTHTIAVVPPLTAVTNTRLRMRVVADYATNIALSACSNNLLYGQMEDYYVIITPNTPLATRIYAEATAVQGNSMNYSFKATEEGQIKSYKLQRAGSDMNFQTLKEQTAEDRAAYSFSDEGLQPGAYYYRVLVTENNGHQFYTRTLAVVIEHPASATTTLQVYPNPAKDNFEVVLPSMPQSKTRLIMTDIYGKKIMEQNFAPQMKLTVHSNLRTGIYFLTVFADNNKWTQKVVIAP